MACSSVNRMDPVEEVEKTLATKKLRSMSNSMFVVVSSSVAVLSERLQNDRRQCKSVLPFRS